ncbi:MAG: hypothetical protein LBJ74_04990 [Heliobacteriaceae bacterium]|jgi:hypothetical protein|nr:hypothetical protein [Heliobacteriaceae bacterium]
MLVQYTPESPSFGKYKCKFSRELEAYIANPCKERSVEVVKELQKLADRRMKNLHIGEGFHNKAYIADDYYVFKIPKNQEAKVGPVKLIENIFTNLKTYFGNTVAQIGNFEIVKNAAIKKELVEAGVPAKIKCNMEKYYETVYLPKFSSLPQKAYDDLAYDCSVLNESGDGLSCWGFDYVNTNNFVAAGKKIRTVDEMDYLTQDENKTSDLMNIFLFMYNKDTAIRPGLKVSDKVLKMKQTIFKKWLLAAEKYRLPFPRMAADKADMDICMEIAGFGNDFEPVEKYIEKLRSAYPEDSAKRIRLLDNYLDALS